MLTRFIVISCVVLFIDWYFFQAVLTLLKGVSPSTKQIVSWLYWSSSVATLLYFTIPYLVPSFHWPKFIHIYFIGFVGMLFFSKLFGSIFILLDDVIRLFNWGIALFKQNVNGENIESGMSRLQFLNNIAIGVTAIPFATFVYGMLKTAFQYKIHNVKINLPKLPNAFHGLRIVQVSDIHAGSFVSTKPLEKAVELINQQNPDLVFFTGDLVNDKASEMNPHINTLSKIKAKEGVYSILGNHDYGDYYNWKSQKEKSENLEQLKAIHAQMGWRLLLNEHISITRNNTKIGIIGVENWGNNLHFTKYGKLQDAHKGTEEYAVKLLLSHDPSHWNGEVTNSYKDIDVTFSGHTHGFQFGIEIPGIKWSPVQYLYKQWAGLYKNQHQYIYVNRGLGFLGYPGRVGIKPEITVIELMNS